MKWTAEGQNISDAFVAWSGEDKEGEWPISAEFGRHESPLGKVEYEIGINNKV